MTLLRSAVLLCIPALLEAQDTARGEPEIATSGYAEVRLPPDRALISFGVQAGAATAAQAASRSGETARRVQAAITAMGIPAADVRIGGFTGNPNFDYREGRRLVDYQARTQIDVRLKDFDRLGRLLDAGLGAGATDASNPRFVSDTAERARESALQRAVASARRDAEALARAAGGRLGAVRHLTTNAAVPEFGGGMVAMASSARENAAPGSPDVNREVLITVFVQARWAYVP